MILFKETKTKQCYIFSMVASMEIVLDQYISNLQKQLFQWECRANGGIRKQNGKWEIKDEFIYNPYMPFKKTECAFILFAPFFF